MIQRESKFVHYTKGVTMIIDLSPGSQEIIPDLDLKQETLDFVFRICGYRPISAISQALALPNFGFFSMEYEVKD